MQIVAAAIAVDIQHLARKVKPRGFFRCHRVRVELRKRHAARRDLRRKKIFRAGDIQSPAFKERSKLFKLWDFDFYRRFALRDARRADKHVAETHIE